MYHRQAIFRPEDVIPAPCHSDSLAMAYALKVNGRVIPLTGLVLPDVLTNGGRNTINFESDEALKASLFRTFSTNHSPESASSTLRELLCCLQKIDAPAGFGYDSLRHLQYVLPRRP